MKKLSLPLVVLVICAIILTGCSTSTTSPTPTAPAVATPTVSTPTSTTPTATTPNTSPQAVKSVIPTASPTPTGAQQYGGTLRWVSSTSPGTPIGWNPETSGGSVVIMQLSLQFLLKEQADGSLTPNLATSYDVVSDLTNPSITFHLQKGVKFHDGSDFNAAAVKWNFEQVKAGGMNNGTTQFWKSFDVIDDNTLRVNLSTWQNRMIRSFADGVAFIASPTAYQKNGLEWMRWHMVGTGPFTQTDFQKDVSITTTRFPGYYEQGKPYLDRIQQFFVTDAMTGEALYKSGGADILTCYSNQQAYNLQAAGYNISNQLGGATVLAPDSLNPDSPWSNLKVRQAAEYAIDKVGLTKAFGYGLTQPAYQLNSDTSPAYDKSLVNRTYDVAKAKQLLTDAGYPNGFKTTIINCSPGRGRDETVAIQANLAKIGIVTDLQFPEAAQATAYLTGTWKNAILYDPLLQWANPNTGYNFYFGIPDSSWFKSTKKPDGWADIVKPSLMSAKVDGPLAQKVEAALYNDATMIPLFFGVTSWAINSNVHDSYIGTRGATNWFEPAYTWLSK